MKGEVEGSWDQGSQIRGEMVTTSVGDEGCQIKFEVVTGGETGSSS